MSIYMYSTRYSAGQDFAGRGGKDSGEARGELQWQSHQWRNEKKPPYMKTRAAPTTRSTVAAIGLKAIEALQNAVYGPTGPVCCDPQLLKVGRLSPPLVSAPPKSLSASGKFPPRSKGN